MNENNKKNHSISGYISESFHLLAPVLKSCYLYIGILAIIAGAGLNFASETYLHNYMSEGKTLPMLSDLILDNLPFYNVTLIYDIFCLIPVALMLIYTVHKKEYNRLPMFLILIGIFYIVRGVFIVLTPFGNPPMFNGSDPIFKGFSKYELGVYPSGHAGNVFLLFLLVKDKGYKWLIFICLFLVITSLFLARGHYSIDVLSGLFFSYAIKAFGEKHLAMFDLNNCREPHRVKVVQKPVT
jgi:membrane-associated phospholipid phosphatase